MPLRDIGEYHAWVGREAPTVEAQRVVRHFRMEIGAEAWRAPSVAITGR